MTRVFTINEGQGPTAEQLKEVAEAKAHPIEFDEECAELSPSMIKAFKCAVNQRNRRKKAQEFSLMPENCRV